MTRPLEKICAVVGIPRALRSPPSASTPGCSSGTSTRSARAHRAAEYQVPPEYLVAILGVETFYGRTHRPVPRARCARDARVRLPAAPATTSAASSSSSCCSPRENKLDPLTTHGLLRRRDGGAAVHALELPALRGRRRQRHAPRPVGRLGRHLRERRQLPAPVRLDARRRRAERGHARAGRRPSRSSRATSSSTRRSTASTRRA